MPRRLSPETCCALTQLWVTSTNERIVRAVSAAETWWRYEQLGAFLARLPGTQTSVQNFMKEHHARFNRHLQNVHTLMEGRGHELKPESREYRTASYGFLCGLAVLCHSIDSARAPKKQELVAHEAWLLSRAAYYLCFPGKHAATLQETKTYADFVLKNQLAYPYREEQELLELLGAEVSNSQRAIEKVAHRLGAILIQCRDDAE